MTTPSEVIRSSSGRLEVHQIPAWQDNFIYLLVEKDSGSSAFIDGPEAGPALEAATRLGIRPDAIFNTHTHFDHIGINQNLSEMGRLESMRVVGPRKAAFAVPGLTEAVDDGDSIRLGNAVGRVLLTEGHMDGHISFLFEDLLFCGDTLFAGGCGYLFDGPPAKMFESLSKLRELDPTTKVLCAHEYTQDNLRFAFSVEPSNPDLRARIARDWKLRAEGRSTVPSTIGLERATNPFLRWESEEIRNAVADDLPPNAGPSDVFAAIRRRKDSKKHRSISDADLPLHG